METGTGTDDDGRNNGPIGHKLVVRRGQGRSANASTPQHASFHNLYKPLNRATMAMPTTTAHGPKNQFIDSQQHQQHQQKNHHSRPSRRSKSSHHSPPPWCRASPRLRPPHPIPSHPICAPASPPSEFRSLARLDYALHRRIRSARKSSLCCVSTCCSSCSKSENTQHPLPAHDMKRHRKGAPEAGPHRVAAARHGTPGSPCPRAPPLCCCRHLLSSVVSWRRVLNPAVTGCLSRRGRGGTFSRCRRRCVAGGIRLILILPPLSNAV
ncbi:hypothetical protein B0T18DRAFT_87263 [Schizothecium vesticola]|uniref:Uncharacterized protein n=1 Tax=Schizothecium vesticola TaxID=314040 RepID=A0AA40F6V7_9PEZI|nr:hypothetical protein B0T18DRAFT_87263 [Schizothecium vesticola]